MFDHVLQVWLNARSCAGSCEASPIRDRFLVLNWPSSTTWGWAELLSLRCTVSDFRGAGLWLRLWNAFSWKQRQTGFSAPPPVLMPNVLGDDCCFSIARFASSTFVHSLSYHAARTHTHTKKNNPSIERKSTKQASGLTFGRFPPPHAYLGLLPNFTTRCVCLITATRCWKAFWFLPTASLLSHAPTTPSPQK